MDEECSVTVQPKTFRARAFGWMPKTKYKAQDRLETIQHWMERCCKRQGYTAGTVRIIERYDLMTGQKVTGVRCLGYPVEAGVTREEIDQLRGANRLRYEWGTTPPR